MTEFLKGVILSLLSEKCYDEYFIKYNFLDGKLYRYDLYQFLFIDYILCNIIVSVPCFKSTLSKGLGIGIIAGSILVKVPQIIKIITSKSAEGINIFGVCLELFAITANFTYSCVMKFPFR